MFIRKARKNLLRRRELHPLDYELHVAIDGIAPPIYRDLLVGEKLFLIQLHRTIQATFGWYDIHDHEFVIGGVRYAEPDADGKLASGVRSTLEVTVGELALKRYATFSYVYDHSARWSLTITVLNIFQQETPELTEIPMMIGGVRAAPPEDCGGVPGYYELLQAIKNPTDPAYTDRLARLGPPFDPELFDLRSGNHTLALMCAWGAI